MKGIFWERAVRVWGYFLSCRFMVNRLQGSFTWIPPNLAIQSLAPDSWLRQSGLWTGVWRLPRKSRQRERQELTPCQVAGQRSPCCFGALGLGKWACLVRTTWKRVLPGAPQLLFNRPVWRGEETTQGKVLELGCQVTISWGEGLQLLLGLERPPSRPWEHKRGSPAGSSKTSPKKESLSAPAGAHSAGMQPDTRMTFALYSSSRSCPVGARQPVKSWWHYSQSTRPHPSHRAGVSPEGCRRARDEKVGGLRDEKVGRREGEEGGFNTVRCSFLITVFNRLFYLPN